MNKNSLVRNDVRYFFWKAISSVGLKLWHITSTLDGSYKHINCKAPAWFRFINRKYSCATIDRNNGRGIDIFADFS
jgi:hypothetical protein